MDLASIEGNIFQHDNIERGKYGEDFTSVSLNLPLIDPFDLTHPKKKTNPKTHHTALIIWGQKRRHGNKYEHSSSRSNQQNAAFIFLMTFTTECVDVFCFFLNTHISCSGLRVKNPISSSFPKHIWNNKKKKEYQERQDNRPN